MSKVEDMLWISQVVLFDNKQAFDHLVRKYQSPIRRFLLNLTMGDAFLSDDLAQETFLKAYLNIRSFQGISAFSTWLYSIAYHLFCDARKGNKTYADLEQSMLDENYTVDIAYSAEKDDIYQALKLLQKEERTAILLCYMEDKTREEAAKIMDIPLGTLKTHLLKGKEKMANFLKVHGYGNE